MNRSALVAVIVNQEKPKVIKPKPEKEPKKAVK